MGRVALNDLVLDDDAVSRVHACILRRGESYFLLDVDSMAGTFVNGERTTTEVELRDGDRIRAGRSEICFCADAHPATSAPAQAAASTDAPPPLPVSDDGRRVDEKNIRFSVSSSARPAATVLSARHLETLSRVSEAIRTVADLGELLDALLDAIHDLFRPDRCVVFLREARNGPLEVRATRPREGGFVVSRSIVDHSIARKETLLVADTAEDGRFQGRQSITQESIRAAISAPLIRQDHVLGAVYLDFRQGTVQERSDDVVLLNLISAYAAIAIENAVLSREKEAATRLGTDEPGPLVAHSAAMQRARDEMTSLGQGHAPVLILGDAGTGKLFAAKSIHLASRGAEAPFVYADCRELGGEDACDALFGAPWAVPFAPHDEAARPLVHTAAGGTLALGRIEGLPTAAQEALAEFLATQEAGERVLPGVRVVAMTAEDPSRLAAPLRARLAERTLRMPRLRERREDVLPLAALFLARRDREGGDAVHTLSPSAERLLSSLPFRHRNVAELKEAIESAADIADGTEVGAEHIFAGPKDRGRRAELDLTGTPPVPWLLRKRVLGAVRAVGATLFLGLIATLLVDGGGAAGRLANGLSWGVWWPALLALCLFAGRVWCTVCPIAAAGEAVRAAPRAHRPPLDWLRRNTGWLVAVLFVAVVWSEQVFRMPEDPRATGVLLLVLTVSCAAMGLAASRDVWCRFVCPLGAMSAGYSVAAPLRVHAHPSLCGSQCKTHECVKGTASEAGCPMFHHPLYAQDAQFCKLCLACVRNCPNGSARLWLRPPLQDLWRSEELGPTLAAFCLVVFLIAPVMLAAQRDGGWLAGTAAFSAAAAVALCAGLAASRPLPRLLTADGDPTVASRASHALLLAAWGPLAAFHLALIPGLADLRLSSIPGGALAGLGIPILALLQVAAVLLATVLSLVALERIRSESGRRGDKVLGGGWAVVCAAWAAESLGSIAILLL